MNLWDLPRTEEDVVRLLQGKGILPTEKHWKNAHPMKLYFGSRIYWKCNAKKCKQQIGLRTSARRDRSFWVTVMNHDRDQKTSVTVMIMAFERKAITVTVRDCDRDSQ